MVELKVNKLKQIRKVKTDKLEKEKVKKKTKYKRNRKTFVYIDPPYYKKGPGLYTNFYNHEDHLSLSEIIKNSMKDKKWILTYDLSDEIFRMYQDY